MRQRKARLKLMECANRSLGSSEDASDGISNPKSELILWRYFFFEVFTTGCLLPSKPATRCAALRQRVQSITRRDADSSTRPPPRCRPKFRAKRPTRQHGPSNPFTAVETLPVMLQAITLQRRWMRTWPSSTQRPVGLYVG